MGPDDFNISSIKTAIDVTEKFNIKHYSQLSLNGHLYKTDSWCWSRPFLSHFTITKISVRRTPLRRTTDALKSSTDTYKVLNVTANYDVGKKTSQITKYP